MLDISLGFVRVKNKIRVYQETDLHDFDCETVHVGGFADLHGGSLDQS